MMRSRQVLIAVLLLMQVAAVAIPVPASSRANDYNNGDTVNTAWTIANAQTYTGGFLIIRNNVTVANGGTLTLDNYEFRWQPGTTETFGLKVQKGGTLIVKNNCKWYSTNSNDYWFQVMKGANLTWNGGTVDNVRRNVNDPVFFDFYGILVFTDNVVFETVTFDKDFLAMQFIGTNGGRILNCSFVNTTKYGMNIINSTDMLVKGSTFNNAEAIYVDGGKVTVDNCKFLENAYTAIFSTAGDLNVIGSTFRNTGSTYTSMTVSWGTFNVTNSTFDATATAPATMISTDNSKGKITGSTFTNGDGNYIFGYNSALDIISNNLLNLTFVGSSRLHIYLRYSTGNISKNNFDGKLGSTGVHSEDCTDLMVAGNQFLNMSQAFFASRFQNITFLKNTYDGSGTAVELEGGTKALVESNTVTTSNEFIRLFTPTDVTLKGNTATTSGWTAVNSYGCSATFEGNNIKMTTPGSRAIYMGTAANIIIKRDKYDVGNGLFAQLTTMGPGHGTFRVEDTTITNANTFTEIGSHPYQVWFINSTFDAAPSKNPWNGGSVGNPGSNLYYGWWTGVETKWQNDAIAPGANIMVKDAFGREVFKGTTDADGKVGPVPVYANHLFYSDGAVVSENVNDNVFKATSGTANGTKAQGITGNGNVVVKMTDDVPGAINFTTPNGWATNGAPVKVEGFASDNGSGIGRVVVKAGTLDFNGTLNGTQWDASLVLDEGDYTLNATAYDVAGNTASATINIRVDRTPPTVMVNTPHYLNRESFNLEGVVDIDTAQLVIDGHLVPVANGTFIYAATVPSGSDHDFEINATDEAGNSFELGWYVNVSTVKPTLVVDVVDGTVTNQTNLHVTGSVSAGVMMVLVNGVSATIGDVMAGMAKFNATLTLLEGSNVVNVSAMDLYGNDISEERSVVLDTLAPMLNITSPEGLAVSINTDTVIVEGSVTEVGTVTILGRTYNVTNGTFIADVGGLKEGENSITVGATDAAGNVASVTLTVFVDTIPPRVTITSPQGPLYTNKDSVQVEGTVEDGATLYVNGASANYTNGTFMVTVPISNGTTQVEVKAVDAAGNEGKAVVPVFYDTETSLVISEDVVETTSEATTVISGVAEPGSNVTIDGVPVIQAPDGSFNATVSLKEGKNSFVVKVTDKAGNTVEKTVEIERVEEASFLAVGADLAILLMMVGILVGGGCGYIIGKKARGKAAAQRPPPQRPAPPAQPKADVAKARPAQPVAQATAVKAEEKAVDKEDVKKEDEEEKDELDEEEDEAEDERGEKKKKEEEEDGETNEKDDAEKDDDDLDGLLKELDSK